MSTDGNDTSLQTTVRFDRWLASLKDRVGAARIKVRIRRLALGNPGKFRNLRGGLSELKIDFGPGYRIYFTERDGSIVILLCGGDKASQAKDIEIARAMIEDLKG